MSRIHIILKNNNGDKIMIPVDNNFALNETKIKESGVLDDLSINKKFDIKCSESKNILYEIKLNNIKENEVKLKFNIIFVVREMDSLKHELDISDCIDINAFIEHCVRLMRDKKEIIYRYEEQSDIDKTLYEVVFTLKNKSLFIEIINKER